MDDSEKKEIYEVARRAVHDELRAIVFDYAAILIGIFIIFSGMVIFINAPLSQPFFSPIRIAGIVVTLIGILLIGITWE